MRVLDDRQRRTLAAAVARVIPSDQDPGALQAGVDVFIERFLGGIDAIYARADGSGFQRLAGREADAWRARVAAARTLYATGLDDLDRRAQERFAADFAALDGMRQDAILADVEHDCGTVIGGKPPANQPVATDGLPFFETLIAHARQGYYADPIYGGNRDASGWKTIGFPGPASMRDVVDGRYSTNDFLAEPAEEWPPPIAPQPRPPMPRFEDVDVCIVGAGAGGGTAAKVLTEAGLRVVALERGPWMAERQFSPDELANFNRYLIWPDPTIHPRTYRPDENAAAVVQPFCPTPNLVGGGTVHWSAWMPRPLESDFRQRSLLGDVPGASLADWPIGYRDLEPYFDRVERALGVAGSAGANVHEVPRSGDFPLPPLPRSRYARRFERACRSLGLNAFPMPQGLASRPYDGRPASTNHGFAQQYGDPTGARASALNTVIRDALRTGRLEIRSSCAAREVLVDERGRACGVAYVDEHGRERVQRAATVILAGGAIETARLLHLSTSRRFPEGLANGSGLLGRNLTLHEYTFAIGLFDPAGEPVYGWAGNYEGGCTFDYYETDERRGHVLGCLLSCTGLGHPINFTYPGRPTWGMTAKDADRTYFNHSMKVGVLVQDLPQLENRVDLDPHVTDGWGLPVARITHRVHPNDLALSRWTVDRAAEIVAASGAERVLPVHIDRITGNCAHQHGTARMGDSADTSVLDRWCRSHEVPNLHVLDGSGFPTSTGVNPTLIIMANAWRCAERLAGRGPDRSVAEMKAGSRG
jgi:choline dehydrogenase-like flavoprotein